MKVSTYIFFGIAVFFLSALTGGIAGVRAGTLFFRAMGWSFGLTGLLYAGLTAIRSFLPELIQSEPREEAVDSDSSEKGGKVDIVVDEETVDNRFVRMAQEEEDDESSDEAPSIIPSIVEELEESAVEQSETIIEGAPSEEVSISAQEVDELPDIGGFAGNFSSPLDENEDEDTEIESGESKEVGNAGNDPAAIAKALQTMLKRD